METDRTSEGTSEDGVLPQPTRADANDVRPCVAIRPDRRNGVAYNGVDLKSLSKTFEELADKYPPEQCPDSVWVLNKGYINWTSPNNGNLDPGPEPGSGYKAVKATPQEMLMPLTAHLHQHFGTAWMPDFKIVDYLADVPWGTVVVERVQDDGSPGATSVSDN
jgi:hypothetical protein